MTAALLLAVASLAPALPPQENDAAALAAAEARLGWRPLFDGHTLAGWHPFGKPGATVTGWIVSEGTLHHPAGAGGGDLVSDASLSDFELELEWKLAPGGNSGIKTRFRDERAVGSVIGPEYQLLDDERHPDAARAETSAAALYALYAPEGKPAAPAETWHRARIVSRGDRIEHWLNGVRVLTAVVGSPDWERRRAESKFSSREDFGRAVPSPIALQDHGDAVWFRALRVRDPGLPEIPRVALLAGSTLAGWRVESGQGRVEEGVLVQQTLGSSGMLVLERPLGDFVLTFEVRADSTARPGVLLRRPSSGVGAGSFASLKRAVRGAELWVPCRVECAGPLLRVYADGALLSDERLDPGRPPRMEVALLVGAPGVEVGWRGLEVQEIGGR